MNYNLKKFKSNLIKKNSSLLNAVKILQKVKYKTLVVIDDHYKIVGTITDGDIRRGMLNGFNLNTRVESITNKKPIKKIIGKNFSIPKNNEDIDLIPCVDKLNKIIDLEILESKNFPKKFINDLEVILMAGGFGKRLMPLTKNTPKPLLKVKKKSLLEIAINNFKKYGIKHFNISTYYKSKKIKEYFDKKKFKDIKINYLKEKIPLGTGGCLSLLNQKKIKENILVYNGDIISNINILNLLKFHQDTSSDITVCAKEFLDSSPFGQIFHRGHKIKKIIEKPNKKNFVNAGIYLIKKKLIRNLPIKPTKMTDFIESKIIKGYNVNIYPIYEYWVDIGDKDVFRKILNKKN
jgi:dTDP-glucose pyrophosphorylase